MTLVFAWLLACGEGEPDAAPAAGTVDHAAMGHDHAAMGHDPAPAGGEHAGHNHAAPGTSHADHMTLMAAMRDELRASLGAAYDAPVPGLDTADKGAGKAVYEQQCMSCHGGTGHGDGPNGSGLPTVPADFTDAFHARYYSDAGRLQIIRKGHVNQGMPAFEGALTDEQMLNVYAYVRTFRGD